MFTLLLTFVVQVLSLKSLEDKNKKNFSYVCVVYIDIYIHVCERERERIIDVSC